jgi:hypothetical protein
MAIHIRAYVCTHPTTPRQLAGRHSDFETPGKKDTSPGHGGAVSKMTRLTRSVVMSDQKLLPRVAVPDASHDRQELPPHPGQDTLTGIPLISVPAVLAVQDPFDRCRRLDPGFRETIPGAPWPTLLRQTGNPDPPRKPEPIEADPGMGDASGEASALNRRYGASTVEHRRADHRGAALQDQGMLTALKVRAISSTADPEGLQRLSHGSCDSRKAPRNNATRTA